MFAFFQILSAILDGNRFEICNVNHHALLLQPREHIRCFPNHLSLMLPGTIRGRGAHTSPIRNGTIQILRNMWDIAQTLSLSKQTRKLEHKKMYVRKKRIKRNWFCLRFYGTADEISSNPVVSTSAHSEINRHSILCVTSVFIWKSKSHCIFPH